MTLRSMLSRMVQRLVRRRSWLARRAGVQAWRPLFLRWARKAAPAARGPALRASAPPAAPVPNHVHWHLHVAVLAGAKHALDGGRASALAGTPPHRLADPTAPASRLAWRPVLPAAARTSSRAAPALPRAAGNVVQQVATPMRRAGRAALPSMAARDRAPMPPPRPGRGEAVAPVPLAWAAASHSAPAQPGTGRAQSGQRVRDARAPRSAWPAGRVVTGPPPSHRPQPAPVVRTFAWAGRARPARVPAPAGRRPAARAWRAPHAAAPAAAPTMRTMRAALPPMQLADVPGIVPGSVSGSAPGVASGVASGVAASFASGTAPGFAPGIALARTLDLAWRAVPADLPGSAGAAGLHAAPGAAAHGSASVAAPVPARSQPAGAAPATALDPALANRLADEIMRRIDLRARIARERRGL